MRAVHDTALDARLLASAAICLLGACRQSAVPVAPAALHLRGPGLPVGVLRVQSRPEFRDADALARKKQFRQAADVMDRLAMDPTLDADGRAYCLSQRDICMKSAGAPINAALETAAYRPVTHADCGPQALKFALAAVGIKADAARIGKEAGSTERGTTMAGLATAARAEGAIANGVQADEFSLLKVRPPAVAWVGGHYVAVLKTSPQGAGDEVIIHDPNRMSEQTMSREQLLTVSKGYLLVVSH